MNTQLKKAIINWLFDHAKEWQRTNACRDHFRPYVFGADGNYLEYGGKEVAQFIEDADRFLFGHSVPTEQ